MSTNGAFTFPGTATSGQGYEVSVKTQPGNPDQVCTVAHGTGQVTSADVTDIAVHCHTPAIPSGLDPTFGIGGRMSTPVGGNGQGEAVAIQPDGKIVTAGWRTGGTGIDSDFALTRTNSEGNLDTSFDTAGVATPTSAARAIRARRRPHPGPRDRGRRRTVAPGFPKQDFARGHLRRREVRRGFRRRSGLADTDFVADDMANAVAVQPDGKIVVAGFAVPQWASAATSRCSCGLQPERSARYRATTRDGIVTTDFGDALRTTTGPRARHPSPDGRDHGRRDRRRGHRACCATRPTATSTRPFGDDGTTDHRPGVRHVADGVTLTPDGKIVIAATPRRASSTTTSCSRATTPTATSTRRSAPAGPSRPTRRRRMTSPRT